MILKNNFELPRNLGVYDIYPRKKSYTYELGDMNKFLHFSIVIVKNWKQSKRTSIGGWINKVNGMYTYNGKQ